MELRKGISPIVATVLLILIAIATGIVIYAFAAGWVGTRFSEATGPQAILVVEKAFSNTTDTKHFTLYVRNDGAGPAKIVRAYVTSPDGTTEKIDLTNAITINPGETEEVDVTPNNISIESGKVYTIKLVSSDGAEVTVRVRA